jgi:hypothetical protein
MTSDVSPTHKEIENARLRREIARHQAEEYAEAERLALVALGPGWTPWMKLYLLNSNGPGGETSEPVAIAYKLYRGDQRLSENSVYVRRMPDGRVLQAERYEPLFGDLLFEPHPTRTVEVGGKPAPCPRYNLYWSALERYAPRSAEQLAAARVKREQRAIDRQATVNPLFKEQIRSGQWRAANRPHGRSPG